MYDPPSPEPPIVIVEAPTPVPPESKAERCSCGAPAAWEVPFAKEPYYEYFCAAHLPPEYIAYPIIWPDDVCITCHTAHHIQDCPSIRALLFAPFTYRCDECGDPVDTIGTCAACQEWERGEQVNADRAIVTSMVRDAFATDYRTGIAYDYEAHSYAIYLDTELVGFANSYHEADITLDQLVSA